MGAALAAEAPAARPAPSWAHRGSSAGSWRQREAAAFGAAQDSGEGRVLSLCLGDTSERDVQTSGAHVSVPRAVWVALELQNFIDF